MSEEIEEQVMVEPDVPKKSGCGCNKNKAIEGNEDSNVSPRYKDKKNTLAIILGVILVGTFIYYLRKGSKVIPVPVV